MNFIVRLLIGGLAVFISAYVLPGIQVDTFWTAIVVAVVLGVLNAVVKPVLLLLTLPITLVTLGLFTFVLSAFMVVVTERLVSGFHVAGFGWALLFSLVLSLVNSFLHSLTQEV